ncbi:MAG: sulfatase-like hydrolase/transferase [Kiritimatiellae bacterium]|nr:sulfatase-like hydrolase/transferase [Kiritimatiellia bacterium]
MTDTKQPNIIFILSDQHNRAVLGGAGDTVARTPNLDRLAANGVLFENAYCSSPLCVPSRTSLLAGLHVTAIDCYSNETALRSDRATFVHALGVAGYETVLAGRMHFVGPDQSHGFAVRLTGDITPTLLGGRGVPYGTMGGLTGQRGSIVKRSGPGRTSLNAYDEAVTQAACDYIRAYPNDKPLFMTIGHYAPHCPYVCPPGLFDYYYKNLPPPSAPEGFLHSAHPAVKDWFDIREMHVVEPEDVKRARAAYYGLVELVDGYTGEILQAVEAGLDPQNTLVVYASDHGDMIGHNGLFWKSNMYEGSVGVPLIFSGAGLATGGRRVRQPVSLLDLAPTLIEIAGGPPLPDMHGENLLPLLRGAAVENWERPIVSLLASRARRSHCAMVRRGEWKMVEHVEYPERQLFNLTADPAEQNDLGPAPEYAALIESLAGELRPFWDGARVSEICRLQLEHTELLRQWGARYAERLSPDVWPLNDIDANNYFAE